MDERGSPTPSEVTGGPSADVNDGADRAALRNGHTQSCASADDAPLAQAASRGDVDSARASPWFLERIPRDFARAHLVLSQGVIDDAAAKQANAHGSLNGGAGHGERDDANGAVQPIEYLVAAESTDPCVLHNVAVRLQRKIDVTLAAAESIAAAIDDAYSRRDESRGDEGVSSGKRDDSLDEALGESAIDRLLAEADQDLLSTDGKGPVVRLVDALLFQALLRKASDLHLQPVNNRLLVRYRLDGVLHTVRELPLHLLPGLVSRIKVMGHMDIAEHRIPQDGRAAVTIGDASRGGRSVDLRISTMPTSHGERVVVRLLDNSTHLCDFGHLGMPNEVAGRYLAHARQSHGMILLTGPTGSGKTTTLYATLRQIGSSEMNIMTVEDPIEYELSSLGLAISQSQVNAKKGVTFASGLRHILRQDPDVIMVGEIRDLETARIAIQASLTGHLVLSTLHTNDAAGAAPRLIDLGIEPYLAAASLSAVLAQRLVRLIHADCRGEGCEACFGTGYQGRMGLFELLSIDEQLRELISHSAAGSEIRREAMAGGMRTLAQHGEELIRQRRTSELEVQRVVVLPGAFA